MKITLELNDRIAKEANRHAHAQGATLAAVVTTALREFLSKSTQNTPPFELHPHVRNTGPQPGVDIERRSRVSDLMDDM